MKHGKLTLIISAALIIALALSLAGCAKTPAPAPTAEPAPTTEPTSEPAPTAEPTATPAPGTGVPDGERREAVIGIEGMEETVQYEHVRDDALGFEMDYDYERFERRRGDGRESFVSLWDDAESPENYLAVTFDPRSAEAAADAISAVLSESYDVIRETAEFGRAGECIVLDASADKNGRTPDRLMAVFIVPAEDGCRIAAAHFYFEAAEGFGRRFRSMIDTFSLLPAQGDGRLSAELALEAVRSYCRAANPDLESIEKAGEYPVYWEVEESGGDEIVVLFRSYTGAQQRFHVDPVSGETYVMELAPDGDKEIRTDETLNVRDRAF